jgi:hypothetical protein
MVNRFSPPPRRANRTAQHFTKNPGIKADLGLGKDSRLAYACFAPPGAFGSPMSFCRGKHRRDLPEAHGKGKSIGNCSPPLCYPSRWNPPYGLAYCLLEKRRDVRRERKGERNNEKPFGTAHAAGQGRRSRSDCGVLVHQRSGHDRRHDRRRHLAGYRGHRSDQHDRRGGPQASAPSAPSAAARPLVVVLVVGPSSM